MPLPLSPFRRAAAEAAAAALGLPAESLAVGVPPDAALGDYAVGMFPAAKTLRAAPPALAQRVAAAFQPTEILAGATAAGPYVNFRLDRAAAYRHLFDAALGGGALIRAVGAGKTVVVDYSSPNVAKHLAYHHIRSTMLGQALCNIHRALGYRVVGINHLGDWGTTFGMLLAGLARWGTPEPFTVQALNQVYVRFQTEAKSDPALEAEGRAAFKRLEDGDAELRALWQRVRDVSLAEFQEVYDLLGVRFDEVRGESDYEQDIPRVMALFEEKGLSVLSDGALVVDLSAENMPPLILRKADGSTIYATRDVAAAMSRWERFRFERSLYVVDRGQSLHFRQLFTTLAKAGFEWAARMEHVPFGLVRIGGKKARTRTGEVVLLKEVLGEATARVAALLKETNPDLPPEKAAEVARDVGVGVIVFSNVSAQREKDVDFEWEDVVSLRGDAGPYVQYAHARASSLLRAGGAAPADLAAADPAPLARDEEWALAKMLLDVGDEVARAADADEPQVVARYLLDLCAAFSRWYTLGNQDPSLKVITADAAATRARLALAASTRKVLATGLGLLGLAAPEVM
jgi:arginyl-tRNA synthetase